MKYLITFVVIISQIFAAANLIVKINNESVIYPITEIIQLDFNQDLDTMYIHTANSNNFYRLSEIESIEYYDDANIQWCRAYTITSHSTKEISKILEDKANYPNVFASISISLQFQNLIPR